MNNFVITATRSMRDYASRVVDHVVKMPSFAGLNGAINGIDFLNTDRFADGEIEVSIKQSVRGKDVVLFACCSRNEEGMDVDEAKNEL